MIRKTLERTKRATYSIDLPNSALKGMPAPIGTGFFVSSDGWFVTAAHVVTQDNRPDGLVRGDIGQGWLMKEAEPGGFSKGMCQGPRVELVDAETDFALLRVDFAANATKDHLRRLNGFPFLQVSLRPLEEGEPVYAFGYPLSTAELLFSNPQRTIGHSGYAPRVTSAVVASTVERTRMISSGAETSVYVVDKALNYGNSGGPIIAAETGNVHALCSRYQQLEIPQSHLKDATGKNVQIRIPSLYGIVSSLSNPVIVEAMRTRGIQISDR